MQHKNFKDLDEKHNKKKNLYQIRVTTFIKGELKNKFMSDCIKRGITESDLAKSILEIYYSCADNWMMEKELTEVKKYINEKIRL